ncbi:hypothetical protein NON08_09430 [Cetobacterium somerae]|uniref:hypothetical protein n=1 Tax=Cetobacterium sp. NK01 TaxID=2993530 RepID=UPI002116402A|nr:hypothetical protein [Cetobacterium sp. NK01]MCQ8212738.1 hypothetical protein [Cetobacterium sp. NK01]
MKSLCFFIFFILNFILTFSSKDMNVDIYTKLNLITPTKIAIKKIANTNELSFKLENSKEEAVRVYIKELHNDNINLYNKKDIDGKLALSSIENNFKGKVTVRVMYN